MRRTDRIPCPRCGKHVDELRAVPGIEEREKGARDWSPFCVCSSCFAAMAPKVARSSAAARTLSLFPLEVLEHCDRRSA